MNEQNNLLIDLLNIFPDDIECLIQAPSLENTVIQSMMLNSSIYDYYKLIHFDKESKRQFIHQELKNSISIYFQSIQIKHKGIMLFEGFDGVEYGTLSKLVEIPQWFREKYIPDTCSISSEW